MQSHRPLSTYWGETFYSNIHRGSDPLISIYIMFTPNFTPTLSLMNQLNWETSCTMSCFYFRTGLILGFNSIFFLRWSGVSLNLDWWIHALNQLGRHPKSIARSYTFIWLKSTPMPSYRQRERDRIKNMQIFWFIVSLWTGFCKLEHLSVKFWRLTVLWNIVLFMSF